MTLALLYLLPAILGSQSISTCQPTHDFLTLPIYLIVVFPLTLIIYLIVVFPPTAHLFDCCMFIDSSILIGPTVFLEWNGMVVLVVDGSRFHS